METFTFRIPRSWAGRITGRKVRAWIARYVAAPEPLKAAPEDLKGRISLRLPPEAVHELEHLTRLSPSEALRRVIAAALSSPEYLPLPVQRPVPAPPKDTDIVSEELIGEDPSGWVIIMQRDRRGFGYQRTLPMDRETYQKARHP